LAGNASQAFAVSPAISFRFDKLSCFSLRKRPASNGRLFSSVENILPGPCGDRGGRAAAATRARVTSPAFYCGWLRRVAENGFDVLITMDSNLSYPQNLAIHEIAIVVWRAARNRLADPPPFRPKVLGI